MTSTPVGGRVLLAEDHPISQRVATLMLQNFGFDVDLVVDGAEAVAAATRTSYRAIFMDCQLPVLDGYEATTAIRHLQGTASRTPIIAVTASDAPWERERCRLAGMDDHLVKPLSLTAVASVLARWAPVGSEAVRGAGPTDPFPAPGPRSALVGTAARPVLDGRVVARLERLGKTAGQDLVGQLTVLFLADADVWVAALREAIAGDDAAGVARSAHTLSGASANIGAANLAALCAAVATNGAADDLAAGTAALEAVEAELERVRDASTHSVLTA